MGLSSRRFDETGMVDEELRVFVFVRSRLRSAIPRAKGTLALMSF